MNPLVIPVVALMVPMVIVPTALWFRYRLRVREMEHAERIRSIELGAALPTEGRLNWPGAALCIAIGGLVPIGSMLAAWGVVAQNADEGGVFGIALVVSCVAIWAAQSLANRMLRGAGEVEPSPENSRATAKSHHDPDAFDVVGSRG